MAELRELLDRVWGDLLARPAGPLHFRFLVQPLMAVALAVRDGVRAARAGQAPYLWGLLTEPAGRARRLREGLSATARVLVLAFVLDVAYQVIELGAFHPVEAVLVAVALAYLPYLIVCGPATRVARRWAGPPAPRGGGQGPPT